MKAFISTVLLLICCVTVSANTSVTPATITYNDDGTISISLTISGVNIEVPVQPEPSSVEPIVASESSESISGTPSAPALSTACIATGATLSAAIDAYSVSCTAPRTDCDPVDGRWQCSSDVIGAQAPEPPEAIPVVQPALPVIEPDPVTFSGLVIEAESAVLTPGWQLRQSTAEYRGSGYIEWMDGDRFSAVLNDGTIRYPINIPEAGLYQLTLRSRITGTDRLKKNDVWVRLQNGQNAAGEQPTDGWRKVFHNELDVWSEALAVDNGPGNRAAYVRYLSAGASSIELSGRSTGYLIDQIRLEPLEIRAPVVSSVRYQTGDLLVLHYDNCPDRDDGHALVAARAVTEQLSIVPLVVNGTCGYTKRQQFQSPSKALMQGVWGGSWLDAYSNTAGALVESARQWAETIDGGSRVWVAEGGPSDFTADVLRRLIADRPDIDLKRIVVVQHSAGWNQANTRSDNMALVQSRVDYRLIDNGNLTNNTADFRLEDGQNPQPFIDTALASLWSGQWQAAFDYLPPVADKLDFSDTVELLYIISDDQTKTPLQFAERYLR